MRLFVCEKPSQGRDIARAVGASSKGDGFYADNAGTVAVTWARGHLYEQWAPDDYDERFKKWNIDDLPIVPGAWRMWQCKGVSRYISAIRGQLAKASEVVIATDAGREGELIAREVLAQLKWKGPILRLWVSAFNDKSLRAALADLRPGSNYEPLYQAALGRARSDWLVGMNVTRALTCQARRNGVDRLFSAGRVQSPTLAMIVRRDAEIAGFVPQPYFVVKALIEHANGRFRATWQPLEDSCDANGRCVDRTRAETSVSRVIGAIGTIDTAETKRKREAPPLLLAQPQVQRLASRMYAMPVDRTDALLQELYDTDKLITYPRTESQYLALSQSEDIPDTVAALRSNLGWVNLVNQADLSLRSRAWNDAKLTDHHAIVPTAVQANLEALDADKRNLYTLIASYYLAQFFPHYEYDQTTILSLFGQDRFKASGRVSVVEGWRQVIRHQKDPGDDSSEGDDPIQALPVVAQSDPIEAIEATVEDKMTRPPSHYTDDTLIEAMTSIAKFVTDPKLKKVLRETSGIGTSATRSDIIKTLCQRGYIVRQKKRYLVSTPEGRNLVSVLSPSLIDPQTTALIEQALADIAEGRGSLPAFEAKTEQWVRQLIGECQALNPGRFAEAGAAAAASARPCPKCGKPLVKRTGKNGPFYGCSGYRQGCDHTEPAGKGGKHKTRKTGAGRAKNAGASTGKANVEVGKACPECQQGRITAKAIKSGKNTGKSFLGCTRYPECKFFQWN